MQSPAYNFSNMSYHSFGMLMPGRKYASATYRFGFNKQERDDEVYGVGNLNTALYWEYDTRLGRRWNIDPVMMHPGSPYEVNNNNPIFINDPDGDCPGGSCDKNLKGKSNMMSNNRKGDKSLPMAPVPVVTVTYYKSKLVTKVYERHGKINSIELDVPIDDNGQVEIKTYANPDKIKVKDRECGNLETQLEVERARRGVPDHPGSYLFKPHCEGTKMAHIVVSPSNKGDQNTQFTVIATRVKYTEVKARIVYDRNGNRHLHTIHVCKNAMPSKSDPPSKTEVLSTLNK